MNKLEAWLNARRPGAPEPLRAALDRALQRSAPASGSVAERLAAAAVATLEAVVRGAGDRASATELLAADALLTYACEAAAREGTDALEALTDSLRPERFAALHPDLGQRPDRGSVPERER